MSNDAEKEILGTILNHPSIIWGAAASIHFKYFQNPQHREIFAAIHSAAKDGQEPDLAEVEGRVTPNLRPLLKNLRTHDLKQRGFKNRLDQIQNAWLTSKIEEISRQIKAEPGDPKSVINKYASVLTDLMINEGNAYGPQLLADLLEASKAEYAKRKERPDSIGTPTGYTIHDRVRKGLRPYRYSILAARPSVGKTTFAVNCLVNCAQHANLPLIIGYSVEMRSISIADRITCAEARVDTDRFSEAKLTPEEDVACQEARQRLAKARFYLEDGKEEGSARINLTLERIHVLTLQLINKETAWRASQGLPTDFQTIVLLDYLQNLRSEDASIESATDKARVTKLSNSLKTLVNATGIHLLVISQLNREGDNEEPTMKHLAASGDIEYDADDILLASPRKEHPLLVKFNLAKQREGTLAQWDLQFIKPFSLFQNPGDIPLAEALHHAA